MSIMENDSGNYQIKGEKAKKLEPERRVMW
jgi:hypothetical protein